MLSLSSASLGRENSRTLFLAEREPLNLFHAADQMFDLNARDELSGDAEHGPCKELLQERQRIGSC
jgi:hypothetical protein